MVLHTLKTYGAESGGCDENSQEGKGPVSHVSRFHAGSVYVPAILCKEYGPMVPSVDRKLSRP